VRARAFVIASAASAAVLLTGWQLGTAGTDPAATIASNGGTSRTTGGTDASSGSSSGTTDATDAAATGSTTQQAGSGVADGTYPGTTVGTRFGDVQVQVTISGGAITDVTPLQLTDHDGRSVSISNRAAPILREEVLQSQSASVSFVSGATYTSDAYVQSLQAALDAAGF
jgi:uncharacterized protein with FMN-binding domain